MTRRRAGEGSVRRRADGRWEARRSIGPRGHNTVLSGYGPTREAAIDDLNSKIDRHNRRISLDDVADWTVADYLRWWIDEEQPARVQDGDLTAGSLAAYESLVRVHLIPHTGRWRLDELTPAHVRRLLETLRSNGVSAKRRDRALRILRMALRTAEQLEFIDRNAAEKVRPTKSRPTRRRTYTADQARRLLAAAADDRLAAYWRLLLTVPLRPGEPLGADWTELDLDNGVYRLTHNLVRVPVVPLRRDDRGHRIMRFERHDLKNHRPRTVPLTGQAVAALRQHRKAWLAEQLATSGWQPADLPEGPVELVFHRGDGQPLHIDVVATRLAALCDKAEVYRVTPHALRHMAVTLMQDAGVQPAVVQQLAGHATVQMTDQYTAWLDRPMREAVDALGRLLS